MARKVTLFTGQWADLPIERMCEMAKDMGYDGLEARLLGRPFRRGQGRRVEEVLRGAAGAAGAVWSRLLGDLEPLGRAARLRPELGPPQRPVRAQGLPRQAGGQAQVGGRGDEEVRRRRAEHGRAGRQRLHGEFHLAHALRVSPGQPGRDQRGIPPVRRDVEADPGGVQAEPGAVRSGGAPDGDRVRPGHRGARVGGDRRRPEFRFQLRSFAPALAGGGPGEVPAPIPRTASSTCT